MQCFMGYSGRIGSRGHKTAACQALSALIQDGGQNTKFTTEFIKFFDFKDFGIE